MMKQVGKKFLSKLFADSIATKPGLIKELNKVVSLNSATEISYRELLGMEDKHIERFRDCGRKVAKSKITGGVKKANYCGYQNLCLACASRRAYNEAKKVINGVPDSWLENKYFYMLTFTMSHKEFHSLRQLLEVIFYAKERLTKAVKNSQDRRIKNKSFFSKFDGLIFSFEITKDSMRNSGFHPHFHCLACSEKPIECGNESFRGGSMFTNKDGVNERQKYIKEGTEKFASDVVDELNYYRPTYIPGMKYMGIDSQFLKQKFVESESPTFRGMQIKKISKDDIKNNTYSRKALGEVFKYGLKLRDLLNKDIVEFAYVMKVMDKKLLTKSGCFRGLKPIKNKNDIKFDYFIEHYEYDDENKKFKTTTPIET